MSVVVPGIEVGRLIELILFNFERQFKRKITQETTRFSFIQARTGTWVGMQVKTIIDDKHFRLRVYVQDFQLQQIFHPFRLESIVSNPPGPQDEVWVAYAVLPKVFFPALSRVRNQIPELEGAGIDIPSEKDAMVSEPVVENAHQIFYLTTPPYAFKEDDIVLPAPVVTSAGKLFYFTSPLYPVYVSESLPVDPVVAAAGEMFYMTTPLYPQRPEENMYSSPVMQDAIKYLIPHWDDSINLESGVSLFILGVDPYTPGNYNWTRYDGAAFEAVSLNSHVSDFLLLQTFFPIDQNYLKADGVDNERVTILSDVTDFVLVQTFFPIDQNYLKADAVESERVTILSDVSNFVLS